MSTTNIEFLRGIIKELTINNVAKQEEAFEFLSALDKEFDDMDDALNKKDTEIEELETEVRELEEKLEFELGEGDDVGLDTIRWELDKGNLRIQQEMENFISSLKKKYIGVAA